MEEGPSITYDAEGKLAIPDAGVTAVKIQVEVTPPNGGCLLYGWDKDGNVACISIHGSGECEVPFTKPTVWIKNLHGTKLVQIKTLAFRKST